MNRSHQLYILKNKNQKIKKIKKIKAMLCCCCCCWVASVVSDSVRPHRWKPTRLPCPWDSPGKNTGVGCHFLLQCMKVKSLSPVRLFATPWSAAYQASLSMGFSRQEYWSGVPLPSPKTTKLSSLEVNFMVSELYLNKTVKNFNQLGKLTMIYHFYFNLYLCV